MTRVNLTAHGIFKFACPDDKAQAFLRDTKTPGLGVRATKSTKAFIFQAKLKDGRTIRTTIGDVRTWGIDDAPVDYIDKMLRAIVGIELAVERWEGVWKVSQNRTDTDRAGVVQGLMDQGTPAAEAMAALVQRGATP